VPALALAGNQLRSAVPFELPQRIREPVPEREAGLEQLRHVGELGERAPQPHGAAPPALLSRGQLDLDRFPR